MRMWARLFVLAAMLLASWSLEGAAAEGTRVPLLIVSLDGFRWDYCDLYPEQTPHLRELKAAGCSARSLVPVFPSNTFPNHYTLVTGLWPAHHGVINNSMFDSKIGRFFRNTLPAAVTDSSWWGGEPIWVTANRQGLHSACSFWPGSEAEIKGYRPTYWKQFNPTAPFEPRLEELLGWLHLPPDRRPDVITFYMEETNSVGHRFGPSAPEIKEAINNLDTRIGMLLRRLKDDGISLNLIIVSDHGMTSVVANRCVALDDFLDLTEVQVDFSGPAAGLRPLSGTVDDVMARLKNLPAGARAYRVDELPARFHLQSHPRIPPIWIIPALGGAIATRASLETWLPKTRGEHGYDPEEETMHGLLLAQGPAFKAGVEISSVENIHLYNLFCALLGLQPAPNDGDERLVRAFLK